MNDNRRNDQNDLRFLLLMAELEEAKPLSQREIAGRLGISLGMVNSSLKRLVKKGMVRVKARPHNRYAYLLTPAGLAEKSRLVYQHLDVFHKLFRITRQDSHTLFRALGEQGARSVSFCGLEDLTEIAYLSLREAGLELAAVMDEEAGGRFIDRPVVSLEEGARAGSRPIVITSLKRAERLKGALLALGVEESEVHLPSFSFAGEACVLVSTAFSQQAAGK